jgi:hypothetical protein
MFENVCTSLDQFHEKFKKGEYTQITLCYTSEKSYDWVGAILVYKITLKATKKRARPLIWRTTESDPESLKIYLDNLHS